jgi:NAD(P)-dependent dehydrogenase (short-subunit alcohol dehydrogenase family)
MAMPNTRIALVTGANQGVGFEVSKQLAANGVTVYLGSRNLQRGQAAAEEIGAGVIALQLDVTDPESISAATARIDADHGRLDLLVQNAGISHAGRDPKISIEDHARQTRPSNVRLDDVRTVWETNVFGVLAVHQAMLPLLRRSADARIVIVSSGVGSLATNADPAFVFRQLYGPTYAASKTALNGIALAIMIELEGSSIKVNLVSPAFTATALNNFAGTETLADGSREVVRVALLGPDGPTNTFTRWNGQTIPW